MPDNDSIQTPEDKPVEGQGREQTGRPEIRLRFDERDMRTSYANAVRSNGTAEEVILDFGMNLPSPSPQQEQPEILFRISDRVVLNYYTAKRLTLALGQIIRRHEEQFGELELDVSKRRKGK